MRIGKLICIAAAALCLSGCLATYSSPEASMEQFTEAMKFAPPADGTGLIYVYRQKEDENKDQKNYNRNKWRIVLDGAFIGAISVKEFTVFKLSSGTHQIALNGNPAEINVHSGDLLFYELMVDRGFFGSKPFMQLRSNEPEIQEKLKRELIMVDYLSEEE